VPSWIEDKLTQGRIPEGNGFLILVQLDAVARILK
jgi:hypothetical protein